MAPKLASPAWLHEGFLRRPRPGYLVFQDDQRLVFVAERGPVLNLHRDDVTQFRFPWYGFGATLAFRSSGRRYQLSFVRPTGAADMQRRVRDAIEAHLDMRAVQPVLTAPAQARRVRKHWLAALHDWYVVVDRPIGGAEAAAVAWLLEHAPTEGNEALCRQLLPTVPALRVIREWNDRLTVEFSGQRYFPFGSGVLVAHAGRKVGYQLEVIQVFSHDGAVVQLTFRGFGHDPHPYAWSDLAGFSRDEPYVP